MNAEFNELVAEKNKWNDALTKWQSSSRAERRKLIDDKTCLWNYRIAQANIDAWIRINITK
jgi:hypothetical protein